MVHEKYAPKFETDGYAVIPNVLSQERLDGIAAHLEYPAGGTGRTRTLLKQNWCAELARCVRSNAHIATLLPSNAVAIQATYFPKVAGENWKVALHRDFFVPVKKRVHVPGWYGWSEKEGMTFARPPEAILAQLVAVRIHLEENTSANGPLIVVPGSHASSHQEPRLPCLVPAGGALAMRPLLLHASSKAQSGRRRVLHFLFAPNQLPHGLEWADAV